MIMNTWLSSFTLFIIHSSNKIIYYCLLNSDKKKNFNKEDIYIARTNPTHTENTKTGNLNKKKKKQPRT